MLDPYASCPCGSGKKFKWCCQAIYPAIQHALEQYASGQHEAALRGIEQVTKDHPGNPEAWGQQARMLYANGKRDEAEATLEKAFALNSNYPFGLLLRACGPRRSQASSLRARLRRRCSSASATACRSACAST